MNSTVNLISTKGHYVQRNNERLALKNIEPSDMERGMFLSDKPFEYAETINGKVIPQKSLKLDLGDNFEVFVADIMRFQRGKFENDHILLDRKIPIIKKTVVLANNNIVPRVFWNDQSLIFPFIIASVPISCLI